MSALRARLEDSARSFGQVFRNPNIRRIEGAWAASILAHWAYGIALAVFAYRDGGAAAVGLVGLVRFLPSAFASPFTALLGDRYRRERVIVVAELSRAAGVDYTCPIDPDVCARARERFGAWAPRLLHPSCLAAASTRRPWWRFWNWR